jgi:hypothetical protein
MKQQKKKKIERKENTKKQPRREGRKENLAMPAALGRHIPIVHYPP